ncbi:RCC1 repeat domain protein [Desulfatibacillum aliphaticivorans]|uniref:RCC1 repeat domain protein n=1 Tax=Desulfatibacillum aliphaticivorans TaxID=218208 RepID=B8FKH1_DESAL|nr:hypothetical protein [Desulfatibacillum aliphaticivorans]ACL01786.1 RCC1 repeat domain protein [Desulfatibacillum aliphaticivorans]
MNSHSRRFGFLLIFIMLPMILLIQGKALSAAPMVAAGDGHTLALKADGRVWAWGGNEHGQLGDGSREDRTLPVMIPGLTEITAIAAGHGRSVALEKNGTVWFWGYLPDAHMEKSIAKTFESPVRVEGLDHVIAIASGRRHSAALKDDGTVWTWYAVPPCPFECKYPIILEPLQIQGLQGIARIFFSGWRLIAIDKDGGVFEWRCDGDGEGKTDCPAKAVPGPDGQGSFNIMK